MRTVLSLRRGLTLMAALMLCAGTASAQQSVHDAGIDAIFSSWNRPDTPGMAVAVVQRGDVIFEKGYGRATLEYDVPITPETVFHVASVSKHFTAFIALLLAERGEISLDEDIRTYLPEIPDFGHTITIRHLIHHTSGLRDQWELLALAGWRLDDVITHDHIMKLVTRQRELNFAPGEEHLYCNTGYTLIAEVVKRTTGHTLREWADEHVFRPLGMTDTQFYDDHERIVRNRAYSYRENASGGFRKAVLSYANAGATSLFTTARDLTRWAVNFEQMDVGSAEVMRRMHEPGVLNSGDTLQYAFGLMENTYRGLRMVGHGGADAGYRSFFGRFPEHDLTVIILSNLASVVPQLLAVQVAEVFLGDVMPESLPEWSRAQRAEQNFARMTSAELEPYTGIFYSDELQTAYRIVRDMTGLRAIHHRHSDVVLVPGGDHEFLGDAWFFRNIRFAVDEDGRIDRLYVTNGRIRNVVFRRVPDEAF